MFANPHIQSFGFSKKELSGNTMMKEGIDGRIIVEHVSNTILKSALHKGGPYLQLL
jgi:hypothetical protein